MNTLKPQDPVHIWMYRASKLLPPKVAGLAVANLLIFYTKTYTLIKEQGKPNNHDNTGINTIQRIRKQS